ncbi:IS5 family transposase, partial [Edwardsiella ictaluri]|nr:IS5 family transposase [Edwardsiella ictaluri]EKS7774202.1 IS5 family transposase [Edwardsiella ictaluri]
AGFWQRNDVLASPTRLASSRHLAATSRGSDDPATPSGSHRLEQSTPRWRERSQPPGGQETGRDPTDRGKLGSKRHIVLERQGIPRAVLVSGANRHDPIMFEPLLDALPALAGKRERPRYRPDKRHADKGYDFRRCRDYLRRRGIKARIARRCIDSHDCLGRYRWVVERTHGWLAGFGKLGIRFERRLDTHLALLTLACAVICLRFVERFC